MAELKLTKNQLRTEQQKLARLKKYLPTLQLKKALLQNEVFLAREGVNVLRKEFEYAFQDLSHLASLLIEPTGIDPQTVGRVGKIVKSYENIAGIEVPVLESVDFDPIEYSLYDTPGWLDPLILLIEETKIARIKIEIAEERQKALEKELREVSIRVNLFEKVLIPKSLANIKKIKVFLDDQQLAFVSQAKAAKKKIEERKRA